MIFDRDTHLAVLSRDWAGLIPAALLGAAGAALVANASPWSLAAGGLLAACALILAAGAAWHLLHLARVKARHPAPGRLVNVGGFRLHVLAEGECKGAPAVVWLPGGHSGGFALYHLHRILREETRSILIDRAGTGWSDIGPFPRTTAREVVEVIAALQSAGEKGPFILAGHSFGGLLAANIARRRPDLTAALILLDATPPDTLIYGPRLANLARARLFATWTAIRHLYGLHRDRTQDRDRRNPTTTRLPDLIAERLGSEGVAARALEARSRGPCATASISTELTAEGMARVGWETAVYDGDLGGLPVLLVAPADMVEFATLPAAVAATARGEAGASEVARMRRIFAHSRERYLATSTTSRRIYSPAGTGHNFPYEAPEFVAEVVRSCLK
ncbi:MAG TPA: alpha/beta hydrolase [Steroidobacteraceae bacterium]|nr:alpha/beta hydrolase [Steroidobacteraceae bacterium]